MSKKELKSNFKVNKHKPSSFEKEAKKNRVRGDFYKLMSGEKDLRSFKEILNDKNLSQMEINLYVYNRASHLFFKFLTYLMKNAMLLMVILMFFMLLLSIVINIYMNGLDSSLDYLKRLFIAWGSYSLIIGSYYYFFERRKNKKRKDNV